MGSKMRAGLRECVFSGIYVLRMLDQFFDAAFCDATGDALIARITSSLPCL